MTLFQTAKRAVLASVACWAGEAAAQPAPAPQPVAVPGDHYQCYKVVRAVDLKPEKILVQDQFGRAELVLVRPVMLCNPSTKVHGDRKYPVKWPRLHLVCYAPERPDESHLVRRVRVGNQFQTAALGIGERTMFCVPSTKALLATGKE